MPMRVINVILNGNKYDPTTVHVGHDMSF